MSWQHHYLLSWHGIAVQQVVDAPVVADTTAASENTSSENVATETHADSASSTTETMEAPADSAVAQYL